LPSVREFAAAVAIDQNGEGWSEHGHGMSLNQQVYNSREVLRKANLKPPYILVGSFTWGYYCKSFCCRIQG
jgi:hypothetical protein